MIDSRRGPETRSPHNARWAVLANGLLAIPAHSGKRAGFGVLHEGTAHRAACQNDASHRMANRCERHIAARTAGRRGDAGQHGRAERGDAASATAGKGCAASDMPVMTRRAMRSGSSGAATGVARYRAPRGRRRRHGTAIPGGLSAHRRVLPSAAGGELAKAMTGCDRQRALRARLARSSMISGRRRPIET